MSDITGKVFALTLFVLLSLWASYLITINVFVYLHDKAHAIQEQEGSRDE